MTDKVENKKWTTRDWIIAGLDILFKMLLGTAFVIIASMYAGALGFFASIIIIILLGILKKKK